MFLCTRHTRHLSVGQALFAASVLFMAPSCGKSGPEPRRDGILRAAFTLNGAPYQARLTVV